MNRLQTTVGAAVIAYVMPIAATSSFHFSNMEYSFIKIEDRVIGILQATTKYDPDTPRVFVLAQTYEDGINEENLCHEMCRDLQTMARQKPTGGMKIKGPLKDQETIAGLWKIVDTHIKTIH
jgi:hypothetical protein